MSLKVTNEITVRIVGDINNFYKMLEDREYKIVDKFHLDDTYFIPKNLNVKNLTTREIISNAVIVRDLVRFMPKGENKRITFKIKEFDEKGNILNQKAINCDVSNIDDAKKLLNAIGWEEIMSIKENDLVYEKDGIQLAVKDIENGDNLIEIETEDRDGLRTIEELKKTVNKLDIPIEPNEYFVKKAEVELNKILKR